MASEDDDFETVASRYTTALDELLAEGRRKPIDPHLRELVQKLITTLEEVRLAARAGARDDARTVIPGLLVTLHALTPSELQRDTAAELLDAIQRAAIRLGDTAYLQTLVASELILLSQDESPIWQTVLHEERLPAPVLEDGTLKDDAHARAWLLAVLKVRSEWQRRRWVRLRLKSRLLWRLAVGLTLLVATTAVAADVAGADLDETLLVVAAGALGATVSGIYKLRDDVAAATAIRAFAPTAAAQVAVGAAAGIFALFLIETGLLDLGGDVRWATLGTAAFAAGFSEPFLLGVVRRVAGSG